MCFSGVLILLRHARAVCAGAVRDASRTMHEAGVAFEAAGFGSRTFLAGDVVPLQFERYLILRQKFRLLQAENFGAPGNPGHPWALG